MTMVDKFLRKVLCLYLLKKKKNKKNQQQQKGTRKYCRQIWCSLVQGVKLMNMLRRKKPSFLLLLDAVRKIIFENKL